MGIFNAVTETVKQGGFRRGALMGIMNPSHPEIFDFCRAKLKGELTIFNLSVMVTDDFMEKATNGGYQELIHDGKLYNTVRAKDILDIVVLGSWMRGDPAILFFDRINKDNKLYLINQIIWKHNFGAYTERKMVSSHYNIFFCTKHKNKYTFNKVIHLN